MLEYSVEELEMIKDFEEMDRDIQDAKESREILREMYAGTRIVVPVNEEHALQMLRVAHFYLRSLGKSVDTDPEKYWISTNTDI
jgi:hypothetical protein